jgi:hypothetical protein
MRIALLFCGRYIQRDGRAATQMPGVSTLFLPERDVSS